MKLLFDECVPFKLKSALDNHHVYSVRMMNWVGYKNGDLINLADQYFDCFITIDKNLRYQQDLTRLRMAIILLNVPNNRLKTILDKSIALKIALENIVGSSFVEI